MMKSILTYILQRLDRFFGAMDRLDLVSHPLKAWSRRFLGAGVGLAILFHVAGIGGVMLYRMFSVPEDVPVRIMPYPSHLIDMIDPATIVTSEYGGGASGGTKPGGESPPEPGDDLAPTGEPVRLRIKIGIPEPVPDVELADPEVTLASQKEMQEEIVLTEDEEETPAEDRGLGGGGGGGAGEGGFGGGSGSGGGDGGTGPPGTWRYDTPPNPRRLVTAVQPRELRDVEGTVRFRLLIDEFGRVSDASIVESSGYAALDALALEAIYRSTFNPATLRGRTVKAWIHFGYGFRVRKR